MKKSGGLSVRQAAGTVRIMLKPGFSGQSVILHKSCKVSCIKKIYKASALRFGFT